MSQVNESQEITIENLPPLFDQLILARALGKSKFWCERSRWAGEGPAYVKLGGSIRYRREDVLKWIEENKVNGSGNEK